MALLGVNCSGRGEETPSSLASCGARFVRPVLYSDVDISGWIMGLRTRGIDVCPVFAGESFDGFASQAEAFAHYARLYGAMVQYWQVGNEADHVSESSWTQTQGAVNAMLLTARQAFPGATLIGPGLVSGNPNWLAGVDLSLMDAVAVHPYGQRPYGSADDWGWLPGNFGVAGDLIDRYAVWGKPIWVTEVGISTKAVTLKRQAEYCGAIMTALRNHPSVQRAAWFAFHNYDGFGLINDNGTPKASFTAYRQAAEGQATEPIQTSPAPIPGPQPTIWTHGPNAEWIGPGLLEALNARGWTPLGGEESGRLICDEGELIWTTRGPRAIRWEAA